MIVDLNFISAIVGAVVSAVVSWIIYYVFFRKKKILGIYYSDPIPILSVKKFKQKGIRDKIKIFYINRQITEDLYIAKIIIENVGNEEIQKEDISAGNLELSISGLGGKIIRILDIQLLKVPENSNINVDVSDNKSEIVIDFDFLNPGERIELRIIFTGDEKIKLRERFRIKGGNVKIEPLFLGSGKIKKVILMVYITLSIIALLSILPLLFYSFVGNFEAIQKYIDFVFDKLIILILFLAIFATFAEKIIEEISRRRGD